MKALYMASPDEYGLVERPDPKPAADEVLLKVHRAGLCHSDVIIRSGKADHVLYPFVPGHEFSGVIEECGELVKHVKVGDRVAVHSILACGVCPACRKGDVSSCENYDEMGSRRDGGFAEYCTAPAKWVFKLPDRVSLDEAAMAEPLANACSVTRKCGIEEGDRVAVIGPGPIGLLACSVARLHNSSKVILVGTRDERLQVGLEMGATHIINIRNDGGREELDQLLDGKGANVVMECAGNPSALTMGIEIAARHGRVAIEGSMDINDTIEIYPRRILVSALHLIGICGWETEDFVRALYLMAAGKVDVNKIITHCFGLEDWQAAFDMITKRKSEAIKVEFALA